MLTNLYEGYVEAMTWLWSFTLTLMTDPVFWLVALMVAVAWGLLCEYLDRRWR